MKALASFACVGLLCGCASTGDLAKKECGSAVKYAGHSLTVGGGKKPLNVSLAAWGWNADEVARAQVLTQGLDALQYGDCLILTQLGKRSSYYGGFAEHRAAVARALAEGAKAFGKASTPAEVAEVLAGVEKELDGLARSNPAVGLVKESGALAAVP